MTTGMLSMSYSLSNNLALWKNIQQHFSLCSLTYLCTTVTMMSFSLPPPMSTASRKKSEPLWSLMFLLLCNVPQSLLEFSKELWRGVKPSSTKPQWLDHSNIDQILLLHNTQPISSVSGNWEIIGALTTYALLVVTSMNHAIMMSVPRSKSLRFTHYSQWPWQGRNYWGTVKSVCRWRCYHRRILSVILKCSLHFW